MTRLSLSILLAGAAFALASCSDAGPLESTPPAPEAPVAPPGTPTGTAPTTPGDSTGGGAPGSTPSATPGAPGAPGSQPGGAPPGGGTVSPPSATRFIETFTSGAQPAPAAFTFPGWDVTIHHNDFFGLPSQHAGHGMDCSAPPASHLVTTRLQRVFVCNDHVMTALNTPADGGYAAAILTPNRMVDIGSGTQVVAFDVSTERTSGRDWVDLWVSPWDDALQLPVTEFTGELGGPPYNGVHVEQEIVNGTAGLDREFTRFTVEVYRNGQLIVLPRASEVGYGERLTPSATKRERFELQISRTHVRFGMPALNLWWVDAEIAALPWSEGVVQFGHRAYAPMKDCPQCAPNTWHWDNFEISQTRSFTIIPAAQREATQREPTVTFPAPAPIGAALRFNGRADSLDVSFDEGATWRRALVRNRSANRGYYLTYWTPIPAGARSARFRGQVWDYSSFVVRDASIWAR